MSYLPISIPDVDSPPTLAFRLALVPVFQFIENLTDRQAADAVRSRLDWKYCLSLELTDTGFNHTVLSEFRTRLVALTAEERFLEAVLDLCKEHNYIRARGRQPTDSTHVLAKIRAHNPRRMCDRTPTSRPQCPVRCISRLVTQPGAAGLVGAV